MKRWDRLLDRFMEEYRARGLTVDTVSHVTRELDRWGRWLKSRRTRWKSHGFVAFSFQDAAEFRGEDRVAIHDQVSNAQQATE